MRVRLSLYPSGEVLMIYEELEDVGGSETNRIPILQRALLASTRQASQ